MSTNQENLILQQLQKMESKIDNLAKELHNTNLEMTRIAGMKHALQDIKVWKENVESIVNADDLREMKKALQEVKVSTEELERFQKEIQSLKSENDKGIEELKVFKAKAKTVVAILSTLFATALTVLGWFVS